MRKKELIYARYWNRHRISTWSGTPFFLRKYLSECFTIIDFRMRERRYRILFRLIKKHLGFCSSEIFGLKMMKENNKRFRKQYPHCDVPIFQFSECITSKEYHSYIYQDLCVDYLLHLYENNIELFNKSNFKKIPLKTIKKRAILQNEYYRTSCDGIFVMGEWLKKYLIEKCNISPNIIHCVGGGINVDISRISYEKKLGKRVLFIGKDFDRKAGALVCEAFKILRKNYINDSELYIVGPRKIAKSLYGEGVYFAGRSNYETVEDYYNKCDIFCMPSYFEAYGLVFPEALCYGLPCIGRNVFAMSEFIQNGKNGYLIDDDDPEKLAELMFLLLNDQEIINYVRNNREYYINKYSWSTVSKKIAEVINCD